MGRGQEATTTAITQKWLPSNQINLKAASTAAWEGIKKPSRTKWHVVLVAALTLVVLAGRFGQEALSATHSSPVNNVASLSSVSGFDGVVDDTATVYIAATVASQLELPVSETVNRQVEDITTAAVVNVEGDQLAKPQAVATEGEGRHSVQNYTVKEGDTLASLAQHFNVSTESIAWANGLTNGSDLTPNTDLRIPPVSGVLHRLAEGDTAESLATKYSANATEIANFNDFEVTGIKPGREIVVPNGVKPQVVTQARTPAAFTYAFAPSYGGNGYDWGWCTWHAANRRAQIGRPIPTNWGNAIGWRYNAAASGYRVGNTPEAGAVVYHKNIGGWGHVAFVEKVTEDGAWFSDMNFPIWGRATNRFVPASEFSSYAFIY